MKFESTLSLNLRCMCQVDNLASKRETTRDEKEVAAATATALASTAAVKHATEAHQSNGNRVN